MKLATVLGATSSNSSNMISPAVVCIDTTGLASAIDMSPYFLVSSGFFGSAFFSSGLGASAFFSSVLGASGFFSSGLGITAGGGVTGGMGGGAGGSITLSLTSYGWLRLDVMRMERIFTSGLGC